ncbi:hypothetical protein D9758_002424 [Tetrapyrgos nigripes]|uniref:DH domain-containing protein n=1 Tax=Tetrapyrgos nigripes TaxID=182062 RepID=A0A8H5LT15_9AGAR|nr:hypothetical protein D9758_002424 [Tetrapyrgos nigripes]
MASAPGEFPTNSAFWNTQMTVLEAPRSFLDYGPDEQFPLNTPPTTSNRSPLLRSASIGEAAFRRDPNSSSSSHSFQRPSKSMHTHLPDSSPYSTSPKPPSANSSPRLPYDRSPSIHNDHTAVNRETDPPVGVGITSDSAVQILGGEAVAFSASRAPVDQSRWSEVYANGHRSRSSSISNGISLHPPDHTSPKLRHQASFDMSWQAVDERDEAGLSEDDTDYDPLLSEDEYDGDELQEEERTSAVVVAEEGRGLIVQGSNMSVSQLQIQPGTTHLLIGSSSTPNAMPAFLTSIIPKISQTLLALDISANFLGALPPVLALCQNLEELNIASNPLRVLPVFLADLTNLRVLIADSTGTTTLPDTLADLDKLHTISVRRNKMHALPSWLCLLPALQSLYVDGNPFQGPWKALVEPLLAKAPMTPAYPLSTPTFPLPSAGLQSSTDTETDPDDSEPPSALADAKFVTSEEDYTITPDKIASAPVWGSAESPAQARPLTRTRTTPNNSSYQPRGRSLIDGDTNTNTPAPRRLQQSASEDSAQFADHELRKMKSAGDLRRGKTSAGRPATAVQTSPPRPPMLSSASSSNLLINESKQSPERPGAKRFASVGPSAGLSGSPSRLPLTQSMWNGPDEPSDVSSPPAELAMSSNDSSEGKLRSRRSKEGKEKSRWGFLKKMSMGKIKPESPTRPSTFASGGVVPRQPRNNGAMDRSSRSPQIDLRFSTTGNLGALVPEHEVTVTLPPDSPPGSPPQSSSKPKPHIEMLQVNNISSSSLHPPSPTPRSGKRRSFLPIDTGTPQSLNIPDNSHFVPGVTATNDDVDSLKEPIPSPTFDQEAFLRKEEERAREAYTRALRSVMAYLKDMNDLGLTQQASSPAYEGSPSMRPRRPTGVDLSREVSIALTTGSGDSSPHLRSYDQQTGLRSGTSSQTMSVATTDSVGSGEERKIKDNKAKRASVAKEILVTERTYVKGLLELMDIYVKPACAPVSVLGGVGSSKETVIPAAELKIVFGAIDSLVSFHKASFLPSLEKAVARLMSKTAAEEDSDGQLSLSVAAAVGDIFQKHAAFMKMYSTYINNFDNAVQRVKYWSSDRAGPGSSPAMSPNSSTAQLASMTMTMSAVSNPNLTAEGSSGAPPLTSSQRRRIRSFLKRCRLDPSHSQLNLEGYLLLPVQRIPRYRLLLEELRQSTPPQYEYMEDSIDRALNEIASLANNMNEGKREAESRHKLVHWQARIRGKFPSPLVQPHRRLIMDGPLLLTRVVRKAIVTFEAINPQGDACTIDVDCLAPELTPRPLLGILCNDLLVLCRDPSEGRDPSSYVDLWAVLRMQTLPQPASIVHGNALRLVDNKAILYFDAPSPSDALNWYRAINLHIPASKA